MEEFSVQERHHPSRGVSFCRAGDILRAQHGDLLVSRHKLRQAASPWSGRGANPETKFLASPPRPFVLCGLPVRRPPSSDLVYERRNGFFTLQITGHPDFGLRIPRLFRLTRHSVPLTSKENTLVTITTRAVKPSVGASSETSWSLGNAGGPKATKSRSPPHASKTPRTPPSTESGIVSARS